MSDQIKKKPGNIIYISHGGGPMPLLGDPGHKNMIEFMKQLPEDLPRPDEILVISAHWKESIPTIISSKVPSLLYDYYGFPSETYDLNYPIPGNPQLAKEVCKLLFDKGIQCESTDQRGFDHGLFIPLKLMYPEADIPVTELSLIKNLNPKEHVEMGKALRKLTERSILIIGSGFSFHNMGVFSGYTGDLIDPDNDKFQNWLIDVCTGTYDIDQREHMLVGWNKAP